MYGRLPYAAGSNPAYSAIRGANKLKKIGVVLVRVQFVDAKDESEAIMKACDSLKPQDLTVVVIPSDIIEHELLTEDDVLNRLKENLGETAEEAYQKFSHTQPGITLEGINNAKAKT